MADNYVPVDDVLQTIIQATMDDTGWITATGKQGEAVMYRRKNGWVSLTVGSASSQLKSGSTIVFVLPAGFRPASPNVVRLASDTVGSVSVASAANVNAKGEVQIYLSGKQQYFNIAGSFPVG